MGIRQVIHFLTRSSLCRCPTIRNLQIDHALGMVPRFWLLQGTFSADTIAAALDLKRIRMTYFYYFFKKL